MYTIENRRLASPLALALFALALALMWTTHAVVKHTNTVNAINQCQPDFRVLTLYNALTRFDLCRIDSDHWALIVNNGETGWGNTLKRLVNYLLNQNIDKVVLLRPEFADEIAEVLGVIP